MSAIVHTLYSHMMQNHVNQTNVLVYSHTAKWWMVQVLCLFVFGSLQSTLQSWKGVSWIPKFRTREKGNQFRGHVHSRTNIPKSIQDNQEDIECKRKSKNIDTVLISCNTEKDVWCVKCKRMKFGVLFTLILVSNWLGCPADFKVRERIGCDCLVNAVLPGQASCSVLSDNQGEGRNTRERTRLT